MAIFKKKIQAPLGVLDYMVSRIPDLLSVKVVVEKKRGSNDSKANCQCLLQGASLEVLHGDSIDEYILT